MLTFCRTTTSIRWIILPFKESQAVQARTRHRYPLSWADRQTAFLGCTEVCCTAAMTTAYLMRLPMPIGWCHLWVQVFHMAHKWYKAGQKEVQQAQGGWCTEEKWEILALLFRPCLCGFVNDSVHHWTTVFVGRFLQLTYQVGIPSCYRFLNCWIWISERGFPRGEVQYTWKKREIKKKEDKDGKAWHQTKIIWNKKPQ